MTSPRRFNQNSIAKNVNSLSSPDPVSGIYIPQELNHCWATIYESYTFTDCTVVHSFSCTTLYNLLDRL